MALAAMREGPGTSFSVISWLRTRRRDIISIIYDETSRWETCKKVCSYEMSDLGFDEVFRARNTVLATLSVSMPARLRARRELGK
jgi:hypothetical protein